MYAFEACPYLYYPPLMRIFADLRMHPHTHLFIYIYFVRLSVCFVCLYQINGQAAKPIGPKFLRPGRLNWSGPNFLGNSHDPRPREGCSKMQNLFSKILILVTFWKSTKKLKKSSNFFFWLPFYILRRAKCSKIEPLSWKMK